MSNAIMTIFFMLYFQKINIKKHVQQQLISKLIQIWYFITLYCIKVMKALILVGGFGTRLRPLTIYHPKSVFPFINQPMVEHQIKALAQVGVQEVILAINYQGEQIKESLEALGSKYKIKITYSKQPQPLGTAGPLRLVQEKLKQNNPQGLFFVLNSDIVCDYPLEELIEAHKKNKQSQNALGTIVLSRVQDPSRFGVVVTDQKHKIESFVQKPKQFISNWINAGMYLLDIKILQRVPLNKKCMIQREIFPQMARKGELFSLKLQNDFWFDIGKPTDYLFGQRKYLEYYKIKQSSIQNGSQQQIAPAYDGFYKIQSSASVGNSCKIGNNVVIGRDVRIGQGCFLQNCTILDGCQIEENCEVKDCIISWRCKLKKNVKIQGLSAFGEQITVNQGFRIRQSMILPNVTINRDIQKEIVMF